MIDLLKKNQDCVIHLSKNIHKINYVFADPRCMKNLLCIFLITSVRRQCLLGTLSVSYEVKYIFLFEREYEIAVSIRVSLSKRLCYHYIE